MARSNSTWWHSSYFLRKAGLLRGVLTAMINWPKGNFRLVPKEHRPHPGQDGETRMNYFSGLQVQKADLRKATKKAPPLW